jgi:YfiR/HmsC-like
VLVVMPSATFMRIPSRIATPAIAKAGIAAPEISAPDMPPPALRGGQDVGVKAAFLFSFAKFVEWPALAPGAPIIACVVGDDGIAAALAETVSGQNISGHPLEVRRPLDSATWRVCQLLFIADANITRSAIGLVAVKALPVLTISDGKDFSRTSGIIELYVEGGRIRFAINADAAERSGLHLSSRLLGLAKIVKNVPLQLETVVRLTPAGGGS